MKKLVILLIFLFALPTIIRLLIGGYMTFSAFAEVINNHWFWVYLICFIIISLIIIYCFGIIKQSYQPLEDNSKSSFWQILTNVFLVLFTFWMGIFVQDLIASKNEEVNNKLLSFQYIDRIHPDYKKVFDNDIFSNLLVFADVNNNHNKKLQEHLKKMEEDPFFYEDSLKEDSLIYHRFQLNYVQYLLSNKKEIIELSKYHDSIMADYKYYLTKEMFDSISVMNEARNIWISTIELLDDSTRKDNIPFSVITKTLGYEDTLCEAKEIAYFENSLKHKYLLHSGKFMSNYESLVDKMKEMYHNAKSGRNLSLSFSDEVNNPILLNDTVLFKDSLTFKDLILKSIPYDSTYKSAITREAFHAALDLFSNKDFSQISLLNCLANYIAQDGLIMMTEMAVLRENKNNFFNNYVKPFLKNPVQTFAITLVIIFIFSVVIIRCISVVKINHKINKNKYDEIIRKNKELNDLIMFKDKEICRLKEEQKKSEEAKSILRSEIQSRDSHIDNLESIIHE